MAGDKESKTEKPTAKRQKEARNEGRIPRSQELVAWATILAGVMVIRSTVSRASDMLHGMMNRMGELIAKPDAGTAIHYMTSSIVDGFVVIAPLMGMFTVLAIIGHLAQVRFVLATKALKPTFSRLNPVSGIKRLMSGQSLWQAAKELFKVVVFGYIAYRTLYGTVIELATGGPFAITEVMRITISSVMRFIRDVAVAGVVIGLVDFFYQRHKINQGLKMTKQEVREEGKQQEGNPEVKGQIRAKQRQMSRNRMMSQIKDADVVIVNPVHLAIALKYDPARGAPRVVAKGAGFVAEKIRDKADEHKVPLVQDIPLARTLHKACDIDDEIPSAMFEAVAKVLAFVFSLKARGTGTGLHKMPGTPDLVEVERMEKAAAKPSAKTPAGGTLVG